MARLIVFALSLFLAATCAWGLQNEQQGVTANNQPTPQAIQPVQTKTPLMTPVQSLPAAHKQTDGGTKDAWNYWDALAPSTWGTWALAVLAGIASWVGLCTLKEIGYQARIGRLGLRTSRTAANAAKKSANVSERAPD